MIFRPANEQDLPAVAGIYDDIHTAEEKGCVSIGWNRSIYPTVQTARAALARGDLFVAEDGEQVVGAAIINQQQVDIYQKAR